MTFLPNTQRRRPPIPGHKLADVLKITRATVNKWRRGNELVAVGRVGGGSNPDYRYEAEAINALLADKAVNYVTPPTIDDLLSGTIVFITTAEASILLHRSEGAVARLVRDGLIEAIRLSKARGGDIRLSLQSVRRHIAASQQTEDLYTLVQVRRVLRLSYPSIQKMIKRGELVVRISPAHRRRQLITVESLQQAVRVRLPPLTTDNPAAWIEDALEDERDLYPAQEAMRQLGYDHQGLNGLLASGQTCLRYITHDASNRLLRVFSPTSIDAYRELIGPVRPREIATVFGIHISEYHRMRREGYFTCPLGHNECPLYRGCVVAILDAGINGTRYSGARWFDLRLEDGLPLLTEREAAKRLSIKVPEVNRLANNGELQGLLLPTGNWRLLLGERF